MNRAKVYVDVTAEFTPDGRVIPRKFIWTDGSVHTVDRVGECCRAASIRAGGVGIRYTCQVEGCWTYIFYEGNNLWFMERNTG